MLKKLKKKQKVVKANKAQTPDRKPNVAIFLKVDENELAKDESKRGRKVMGTGREAYCILRGTLQDPDGSGPVLLARASGWGQQLGARRHQEAAAGPSSSQGNRRPMHVRADYQCQGSGAASKKDNRIRHELSGYSRRSFRTMR